MTLHLTPALEQRLDQLAAQTHRSPTDMVQESVEAFLDYEERSMAIVARGRADIAAGRVVDHSVIAERFGRPSKSQ